MDQGKADLPPLRILAHRGLHNRQNRSITHRPNQDVTRRVAVLLGEVDAPTSQVFREGRPRQEPQLTRKLFLQIDSKLHFTPKGFAMRIIVHIDLVLENGTVSLRPHSWTPAGSPAERLTPEQIYQLVGESFNAPDPGIIDDAQPGEMQATPSAVTRGKRLASQPVAIAQDDGLLTKTLTAELAISELQAANAIKMVGRARVLECLSWVRTKIAQGGCRFPSALFFSLVNKGHSGPGSAA